MLKNRFVKGAVLIRSDMIVKNYAQIGEIKSIPEDFKVVEQLGFDLTGVGEHVWLYIQKRLLNTQDVTKRIARLANVPRRDVGYSGLKDKLAVTEQWFSIYLPKGEVPDWKELNDDQIRILEIGKHAKKLRIGTHKYNHFVVTIRDCRVDPIHLAQTIIKIKGQGFLNLFAEQRFGRENANVTKALDWLSGNVKVRSPKDRGFLLSVLRSYLFNRYVLERNVSSLTKSVLCGDIVGFVGANTWFLVTRENKADVVARILNGELVVAGILPGKDKKLQLTGDGKQFAEELWADYAWYKDLLAQDVEVGFRALSIVPIDLSYVYNEEKQILVLDFSLPTGSYATTLFDELSSHLLK